MNEPDLLNLSSPIHFSHYFMSSWPTIAHSQDALAWVRSVLIVFVNMTAVAAPAIWHELLQMCLCSCVIHVNM